MTTIVTKDGIYLDVPQGMALDAPEVRSAVEQERIGRRQRRIAGPEGQSMLAQIKAQDSERGDPTQDMGAGKKVLANIGAGMMDAGIGVKQMLGTGPSDEVIRDKRERDKALAQSTDMGILPDWMPTAGSALQVAGEAAPAMVIPAGAATGAAARLLPRAVQALTRTPLRAGMTGGAVGGSLTPTTSDESRLVNMGIGAGAGALLPLGMAAWRLGRGLTQSGAREEAGKMMLGITDENPMPPHPGGNQPHPMIPADPAALGIPGAENVRLSTAATYNDPRLAGLELASRARQAAAPEWGALDREARQAVWQNVEDATQRAGTEGERRAERAAGWREQAARAFQNVRPRIWEQQRDAFRNEINRLSRTPKGQGEMRGVYYEIGRQMDEMGDQFTPQFLAEIRSRMAGSIKGSPADPFVSAPRADPAFRSLRDQLDDILNKSTGNRWDTVKTRYERESIPVSQAKAESAVRGTFVTPEDTFKVPVREGGPDVTEAQLRKAITGVEQKNKFGNAPSFAPDSGRVLKGTLQALQQQNITGAAKKTATGGGGSMTTPLAQAIARVDPSQAGNWIEKAITAARGIGHARALTELDHALTDPRRYYDIVLQTIEAGRPMSPAQELAIQAINVGGGTALPRTMQSQQER